MLVYVRSESYQAILFLLACIRKPQSSPFLEWLHLKRLVRGYTMTYTRLLDPTTYFHVAIRLLALILIESVPECSRLECSSPGGLPIFFDISSHLGLSLLTVFSARGQRTSEHRLPGAVSHAPCLSNSRRGTSLSPRRSNRS